ARHGPAPRRPVLGERQRAGQCAGHVPTQPSNAARHAATTAVCPAAHACAQAGRLPLQAATHPGSVDAVVVTQSPIPVAQAATQAAEGGKVWAPAFRAGTTVPPIDAAHASTQSTLFTNLMAPPFVGRATPEHDVRPTRPHHLGCGLAPFGTGLLCPPLGCGFAPAGTGLPIAEGAIRSSSSSISSSISFMLRFLLLCAIAARAPRNRTSAADV